MKAREKLTFTYTVEMLQRRSFKQLQLLFSHTSFLITINVDKYRDALRAYRFNGDGNDNFPSWSMQIISVL